MILILNWCSHRSEKNMISLAIVGAELRAPHKSGDVIMLWCSKGFRRLFSISHPWLPNFTVYPFVRHNIPICQTYPITAYPFVSHTHLQFTHLSDIPIYLYTHLSDIPNHSIHICQPYLITVYPFVNIKIPQIYKVKLLNWYTKTIKNNSINSNPQNQ